MYVAQLKQFEQKNNRKLVEKGKKSYCPRWYVFDIIQKLLSKNINKA
jgi:hypothetical protein